MGLQVRAKTETAEEKIAERQKIPLPFEINIMGGIDNPVSSLPEKAHKRRTLSLTLTIAEMTGDKDAPMDYAGVGREDHVRGARALRYRCDPDSQTTENSIE